MRLAPIRALLDRAAENGSVLEFWLRDDDAVAPTPALDRLLGLARSAGAPLAVAAIPDKMEPKLAERVASEPGARILVHGLAHLNHATEDRKSAEFGDDRPLAALRADAQAGLEAARESAAGRLLPVFVPPWNRIAPALADALPALGYAGLSTFGARRPVVGLAVANTYLDPVDWRGSRSAVEPASLAAGLNRALGTPDPGPIGILTHHLVFDEALWALTAELLELLGSHSAVRFPALDSIWSAEERH